MRKRYGDYLVTEGLALLKRDKGSKAKKRSRGPLFNMTRQVISNMVYEWCERRCCRKLNDNQGDFFSWFRS